MRCGLLPRGVLVLGWITRVDVSVKRRLRVCRLLNEPGSLVVTWTEEVEVRMRRTLFAVVQFY